MNPKKAKLFIPEVAREQGASEELVTDVINFYWSHVRKNMSALSSPRIHLTNLGDMTIKHWNIEEKITSLQRWEENNKQKGIQQMKGLWNTAELLFNLENMKKMFAEEQQRKEFIQLHKRTAHEQAKKEHIPDLEEQGPDLGGNKE